MEGKGQTSLDFAAGMSTFLLVFAFVLSFVPGMFQPFTASDQEQTVVADRVADQLVGGLLGDPMEPHIITKEKVNNAFSPPGDSNGCRFDPDDPDEYLYDRLGVSNSHNVHISITVKNPPDVCEAGTSSPPEASSVVVSRRTVLLRSSDGSLLTDSTILVKVW